MRVQVLIAVCLVLLLIVANVRGDEVSTAPLFEVRPSGLLTTRLSEKELEKWAAIERIVFAEDSNQQSLHPTLRSLWEWIETSGHTVYVEFVQTGKVSTCTAGLFLVEQFDPRGERHIAVIKLNLANINQAYVGPGTRRQNGFVPFLGLEREERYAEVLGHELAHAAHILTNLERTRKVEDIVQQTNQILLSQHRRRPGMGLAPELKRRLSKRDIFLKELEEQAEAMEKVVWEELAARKPEKAKLLYLVNK